MWEQGEHVSIVGDTGSGKTFLTSRLLAPGRFRSYVLFLRTKADDIRFPGYTRIRDVRAITVSQHYYLLDPPRARRRQAVGEAFERVLREGGWTVCVDELWYVEEQLKLGEYVEECFTQGRSQGITVVAGMQRPVRVTRFALSQSTHVFAFEQEGRDAKELAAATSPRMVEPVQRLARFQFAYFNRRTRAIAVARAQQIERVFDAGERDSNSQGS